MTPSELSGLTSRFMRTWQELLPRSRPCLHTLVLRGGLKGLDPDHCNGPDPLWPKYNSRCLLSFLSLTTSTFIFFMTMN